MSLIPYLRLLDELAPATIWDQDFGHGLFSHDLALPTATVCLRNNPYYIRPWRHQRASGTGVSSVVENKDEFKVNLDVQQFKPEQINVKVVDNFVVIEGKHEERQDEHGYISRQFQRRYLLPKEVDPAAVQSQLSSDGVLTITAPKAKALPENERSVPIVQTNQPAVKAPEPKKTEGSGDKMEQ